MDNDRDAFEKSMTKLGITLNYKGDGRYGLTATMCKKAWDEAISHNKERIAELEKDAERWNFVLSRTELTDALFNAMPFCFGSKHINNRIDIEIEAMKGSNDVN